jgi:predicted ATP-dependent endonuclease of OLD family
VIKWFVANKLVLNLNKTNIMKFITTNSSNSALCVGYKETHIARMVNTKFLVTYRFLTIVMNE